MAKFGLRIVCISIVGVLSGCASTKIAELESRLARIENDLYHVRVQAVAQLPSQVGSENKSELSPKKEEKHFAPIEKIEPTVAQLRLEAFVKEYFGVEFGMPITNCFSGVSADESGDYYISLKKDFDYFNQGIARFIMGKLWAVDFLVKFDERYSVDSVSKAVDATKSKLQQTFGDTFTNGKNTSFMNVGPYKLMATIRSKREYAITLYDARRYSRYYGEEIDRQKENADREKEKAEAEERRKDAEGETLPIL